MPYHHDGRFGFRSQVLAVLSPSLPEDVGVEEDGEGQGERQVGAEKDGEPGMSHIDQVALPHGRHILDSVRPDGVREDVQERHVEIRRYDESDGHAAANDARIAQGVNDGDVTIQGHSDHEAEGAEGGPHGQQRFDLTDVCLADIGHVKVEGDVEGDDEADGEVGTGQGHHKVIRRGPEDGETGDGGNDEHVARHGHSCDQQVHGDDEGRESLETPQLTVTMIVAAVRVDKG